MFGLTSRRFEGLPRVNMLRRRFLASASVAGAAALGSGLLGVGQSEADATLVTSYGPNGHKKRVTDIDIGNFALNLEYLEAEYYLFAFTGSGLPASQVSGVGENGEPTTPGPVTGGRQVPFADPVVRELARQLAGDEQAHVEDLRGVLGREAVARPAIDIGPAFSAAAVAAGIIRAGQTFDPYANDANFLLGAFIFEDVGVTAYHGGAPYIRDTSILSAAAGILGVEAYHAGNIRHALITRGQTAASLITDANKISALRAAADGDQPNGHETPLTTENGTPRFVAADPSTAIAYARTFEEVLRIVYLGNQPEQGGGFFPDGLNGLIR